MLTRSIKSTTIIPAVLIKDLCKCNMKQNPNVGLNLGSIFICGCVSSTALKDLSKGRTVVKPS
jgi:hypothetical protein